MTAEHDVAVKKAGLMGRIFQSPELWAAVITMALTIISTGFVSFLGVRAELQLVQQKLDLFIAAHMKEHSYIDNQFEKSWRKHDTSLAHRQETDGRVSRIEGKLEANGN